MVLEEQKIWGYRGYCLMVYRYYILTLLFQQDFAALQREVKTLRQSFDYDTKIKNEREGSATKKLGELQYGVDSRLEAETAIRHEQINIIKREIERLIKYAFMILVLQLCLHIMPEHRRTSICNCGVCYGLKLAYGPIFLGAMKVMNNSIHLLWRN